MYYFISLLFVCVFILNIFYNNLLKKVNKLESDLKELDSILDSVCNVVYDNSNVFDDDKVYKEGIDF